MKFTSKNIEILGIILVIMLLILRPKIIKTFSENMIGKSVLLAIIVALASHKKIYGLVAAFTLIVCMEFNSEGKDRDSEDSSEGDSEGDSEDSSEESIKDLQEKDDEEEEIKKNKSDMDKIQNLISKIIQNLQSF